MYIVFEGVVWTWKTTQSKRLAAYLQEKYPDKQVVWVREPGTGEIADAIRTLVQWTVFGEQMDPLCEAYLYAASRAQLIMTRILPLLEQGGIVVCDRNVSSSLAYQGYAKWAGIETIWSLNREVAEKRLPDMTLYMDLSVEEWLARTFDAAGDKHEREWVAFFERAAEGYHYIAQRERFRDKRHIVDATGSQDEVFERVVALVDNFR